MMLPFSPLWYASSSSSLPSMSTPKYGQPPNINPMPECFSEALTAVSKSHQVEGLFDIAPPPVSAFIGTFFIFPLFLSGTASQHIQFGRALSSCGICSYIYPTPNINFEKSKPFTYPRKTPLLLHKKYNNCRNVAKLKYKSFVCTKYHLRFYAKAL